MLGGPYDLIGKYNLLAAAGSANQPYLGSPKMVGDHDMIGKNDNRTLGDYCKGVLILCRDVLLLGFVNFMMGIFFRSLWVLLALGLVTAALNADVEGPPMNYWVFEGEVLSKDVRLDALTAEDLIFAGSFAVPAYAPRSTGEMDHGERYIHAAREFEFTLDRFHILEYEGFQAEGWQWFDVMPGIGGEEDRLFILFPAYGSKLGDSVWQVSWVQIGMQLKQGTVSPSAEWPNWGRPLDWKNGWFRIFLEPESGNDEALIEGVLREFRPAGEPAAAAERIEELEAILAGMARRLNAVEQENRQLSRSLALEQQRVVGMTRTLDRLIEERESWNSERERLLANQLAEDDVWKKREAEWEVALALKEESYKTVLDERALAEQRSQDLTAELQRLQRERDDLQGVIERWRDGEKQNRNSGGSHAAKPAEEANSGFRIISDVQSWEYLDGSHDGTPQVGANEDSGESNERVIPRRRGPRGRL